ncbi:glycyl-tRNA synthetase subunit alpha [Candidatus Tremblaya phenacola PAVE]|nr:glycyl-tRNA synthetase subunit alpha [Candidatus Tremblaya phenacola PAVE]
MLVQNQVPQLLQNTAQKLGEFWHAKNYQSASPIDLEVGAGTSHWRTFFQAVSKTNCNIIYPQPSRRPKDSRFSCKQDRLYLHTQFQVIMRPIPNTLLFTYFNSLRAIGLELKGTEIKLIEDCWSNPTLGAYGTGWEVTIDGQEITQITFFQRMGGLTCYPRLGEVAYGLDRIVANLPTSSRCEIEPKQPNLEGAFERENSFYSLNYTNNSFLRMLFKLLGVEVSNLIKNGFVMPSYELLLKMCHTFNLLVARGNFLYAERLLCCSTMRSYANLIAKLHRTKCFGI